MEDPGRAEMRAADADRERVLEVVRQAHAEGRLDTPEFYDRLDGVYQAKTFGELDALVVDLPVGTAMVPGSESSLAPASASTPRPDSRGLLARMPSDLRGSWIAWATAVSINVTIWLIIMVASGLDPVYFWPIWVAGPWGLVNAGLTLSWLSNRGPQSPDDEPPPALPPGR